MAQMHILNGDGQGSWRVAMHFDVPDANNAVGVNYRTALIRSGIVEPPFTVLLEIGDGLEGTITVAEKAELAAGIKVERVFTLAIDGKGATNASRIASLSNHYNILKAITIDKLKHRLKFFGHTQP